MPASCDTPDCAQSSLRSGPVFRKQRSGVLPSNCPQPLELSQPSRGCLPCPPSPKSRTSQRLLPTATWGRPGKPAAPRPSGRCVRLPAPPWTPRLRWSRTEFLSLLGPVLKAWPSPSPCIPQPPPSHVPAADCPRLRLGRGTDLGFPAPKPLRDWPTNGAVAWPLLRTRQHLWAPPPAPSPQPAGALSGLGARTAGPSIHRSRSGCPRPPLPVREREQKVRRWASSAVTPERARRRGLHKRHGSLGYYLTNTLWPPRAHLSPSVASDLAHPDLRALRLRLLGTRVTASDPTLRGLEGSGGAATRGGPTDSGPAGRSSLAHTGPLCPRGPRHLARGPCRETTGARRGPAGRGEPLWGWGLQRAAWERSA